jgi:hypothetical protein
MVDARKVPVLTKSGYPQDLLTRELEFILWQSGKSKSTVKDALNPKQFLMVRPDTRAERDGKVSVPRTLPGGQRSTRLILLIFLRQPQTKAFFRFLPVVIVLYIGKGRW